MAGATTWSLGRRVSNQPFEFSKYRDAILVIIRLSLGYPLLASVVFTHDAFSNHLNSTPPLGIAGALGLTLMFGLRPHWVAGLVAVWMTYIVVTAIGDKGLYWGLDSAKRELGLLAGAATYGGVRGGVVVVGHRHRPVLAESDRLVGG